MRIAASGAPPRPRRPVNAVTTVTMGAQMPIAAMASVPSAIHPK